MIYAALFLIIAILLFGAGAVKGFMNTALAFVLGLVALGIFAYFASDAFGVTGAEFFVWLLIGIPAALFGSVVLYGIVCLFRGIDPATGQKRS